MPIESFQQALMRIAEFDREHSADLPEFTVEAVRSASALPSPRDRVADTVEALYACKNPTSDSLELVRDLASFTEAHGFLQDDTNGYERSAMIFMASRRELKEGPKSSWPKKEKDPIALSHFVEPEPDDEAVEEGYKAEKS